MDIDPFELVAMLSPRAVDSQSIQGTQPLRLSPADIAAKLSKCSKGASYLVRIKYARQEELLRSFILWVMVQAPVIPVSRRKDHKPGMLEACCILAVREVLDSKICPSCNGTRPIVHFEGEILECRTCAGVGRIRYSSRFRAGQLRIPWTSWRRTWENQYEALLGMIWDWEREGREAIRSA